MAIIHDRSELTSAASGDVLFISDISDTTDAATGTDKKITVDNLVNYIDAVTATFTNKTIDSASNTLTVDLSEATVTGTTAEFNTALSDGSFATLAGTETLTNKTINTASNTITIVEADISDLGSYLTDIVSDTTPQLGGNLDVNGNDIRHSGGGRYAPSGTDTSGHHQFTSGQTLNSSSGTDKFVSITGTVNQTGTAATNFLEVDITNTAAGSGTQNIMALQVGAADRFTVDTSGNTNIAASAAYSVGGVAIISDSSGTTTLSNIDAIDATTETTLESAIDSLSNLTVVGTVTSGNVDAVVSAASTTTAGKIEVATSAETNTGTDAGRAVSPDGLAGSNFGIRYVSAVVVDFGTATATGDGKFYFHIPPAMDGMNLVYVHAEVITAGTTGTTDIQIHNVDNALDMLSTKLTIDSGETGSDTAATAAVINTSNDHVNTNDVVRIDVDAVSTTPANGLIVTLGFQLG